MSAGPQRPSDASAPAFEGRTLATAVGGRLLRDGHQPIRAAAVDSRRVRPGMAFFALRGEHTDGHRFLDAAIRAGAAALVVSEVPDGASLDALAAGGAAVIAVPDAGAALLAAARAWRARWDPLVVGITGSLAKTSTKEQVGEVLAERWSVLRTEGNENNEIGLPLTILRSGPEHAAWVLEMGFYVPGEIDLLARLARPTIGVVTAVRGVHLSRAGSIDAIEAGKRELIEALPAGGTAVLNADDVRVTRWSPPPGVATIRYGLDAAADVTAADVRSLGADGMAFTLVLPDERLPVATPALGRHSVHNALAAAAVGYVAGLDAATIARGVARGFRAPHRTALVRLPDRLVLDDSYNASPDSMVAALELLATLPGRHLAVLGEMRELGDGTLEGHLSVGRCAAALVDVLLVVGEGAAAIADGAAAAGMPVDRIVRNADRVAATAWLAEHARPGDAILVKASRGAALDLLVDDLVRLFDGAGAHA